MIHQLHLSQTDQKINIKIKEPMQSINRICVKIKVVNFVCKYLYIGIDTDETLNILRYIVIKQCK